MDEVKGVKILKGTEGMDFLLQQMCAEIPSMSREELESKLMSMLEFRREMWKEHLTSGRTIRRLERTIKKKNAIIKKQNSGSLLFKADVPQHIRGHELTERHDIGNRLGVEETKFRFQDTRARYFQVKEGSNYRILVQQNNGDDDSPAIPYRNDKRDPSHKPVVQGSEWCLDRCIGVIDIVKYENRILNSDTDMAEVVPSFKTAVSDDLPPSAIKVNRIAVGVTVLPPIPNPTAELEKMVGCDEIKRKIMDLKSLTEYNKVCYQHSPELPLMKIFLHSLFYGNPGTGKSTMCRLYGSLLKDAGILSKGHVVVADRSVFIGDCFGDTEAILNELINYSQGGVLMFDEAYLLEGTHPSDPNKMVLPMLLSALADDSNKDWAVVLCGYKDKLDKMIDKNPGLYSRFVNRFDFKDYSLDELTEIGIRYLRTFGHVFSPDGLESFRKVLSVAMYGNRTTWANARTVKSLIDNTIIQRAKRYAKEGRFKREIIAEDISSIPTDNRRRIGFSA